MSGGEGADSLSGFGGDDSEDGGEGPDLVTGGDGNDSMAGGAGDDQLGSPLELTMGAPPERGDDTLEGGPGDDVIRPGAGPTLTTSDSDTLLGGEGRDVVTYDQRAVELAVFLDGSPNDGAAGEGDNVGAGVERLVGGASDDRLTGSAAADEIDGGRGADVVEGGAGDDTLDGGVEDAESDTLAGGDGADLLRGNAGDDAVGGDAGSDTLQGGEGDDNMRGGGDVDVMTGEAGADELAGGTGNDRMDGAGPAVGEDASDVLRGDDGNDDMRGGAANDTLVGGNGADSMRGEAGTDAADYGLASRPVTVELDGEGNDGAPGERDNVGTDVEDVVGGGVEDTFTGSSEANRLDGGAGEDYVDGASDTDDLRGGAASDVVRARDGERDLVQCGRGPDLAIADPADEVSRNCELADRGTRNVPELGREFVIQGVSGGNQFGLPQMDRTVPLKDLINLPVGSKVDARRGRVSITAAARTRRRRASGVFSDGLFAVLQRRSGASVTELRLRGGNFRRCSRGGGAQATAAQRRRLTIRRLTGRARGRFRTRGNHSAATVRGTAWEMVDRCDGTLTRVRSGVVRVTDFRRRRTVTVRAGQSYLAKAPREGG